MSDTESIREDAKRDEWYDANSAECPECGGTMIRTGHQPADRYEPGFEIWECEDRDGCGFEGEN